MKLVAELWNFDIEVIFIQLTNGKRPFSTNIKFINRYQCKIHKNSLILQAEMLYKGNPNLLNQFQYCEENNIPFCAVLGDQELAKGFVTLKNMITREQVEVKRDELPTEILKFYR